MREQTKTWCRNLLLAAGALSLTLFSRQPLMASDITISIGSNTITFPSANPSTSPVISANENPVHLSLSYSGVGTWAATMLATTDLISSGGSTIPISNVGYVGTGAFNVSGNLSKITPVILGTGVLTTQPATGNLSFNFANSWSYNIGTYSTSIVITAVGL